MSDNKQNLMQEAIAKFSSVVENAGLQPQKKDITPEEAGITQEVLQNVLGKKAEIEKKQNDYSFGESQSQLQTTTNQNIFHSGNVFEEEFVLSSLEEPAVKFILPTKGKGSKNPFLKRGFINIKPLNNYDEEILLNLKNSNETMDDFFEFLNSKIVEDVNVAEIALADLTAIPIFLKSISDKNLKEKEKEKIVETIACPLCNEKSIIHYGAEEIDITEIDNKTEMPFKIELSNNVIVYVNFMTYGHLKQVKKAVEYDKTLEVFKKNKIDTTRIREWQIITDKIYVENQLLEPKQWFNFYLNLSREDKKTMKQNIDKISKIGVATITKTCNNCKKTVQFPSDISLSILFTE